MEGTIDEVNDIPHFLTLAPSRSIRTLSSHSFLLALVKEFPKYTSVRTSSKPTEPEVVSFQIHSVNGIMRTILTSIGVPDLIA